MLADYLILNKELRFSLVDLSYLEFITLLNGLAEYYNGHNEKGTLKALPALKPLVDDLYFLVEDALKECRDYVRSSGDPLVDAKQTVEIKDFLDRVVSYNAKKRST